MIWRIWDKLKVAIFFAALFFAYRTGWGLAMGKINAEEARRLADSHNDAENLRHRIVDEQPSRVLEMADRGYRD